jgi:hypothetical protein
MKSILFAHSAKRNPLRRGSCANQIEKIEEDL